MSLTHRCPVCGTASEISFLFDHPGTSYMILDDELIGLTDIASRLHCPSCDWQLTGVLRDTVVDLASWRITAGQFVPHRS